MTAHAAFLPEQVLAFADRPTHIAADQHHVRRMASLAARFRVFLGKQRPQPMFVIAVSFLFAGGSAPVALMARRAAKLVGIVRFQQFGLRMADESLCIFVWLLSALSRH